MAMETAAPQIKNYAGFVRFIVNFIQNKSSYIWWQDKQRSYVCQLRFLIEMFVL